MRECIFYLNVICGNRRKIGKMYKSINKKFKNLINYII